MWKKIYMGHWHTPLQLSIGIKMVVGKAAPEALLPGGAIRTLTLFFFFYYGIHSLLFGGYQTLRYLSW